MKKSAKLLKERRLMYDNMDEYNRLISIGYSKEQALKILKNKPGGSLSKLKKRIQRAKTFNMLGVSLKGIRLTNDVKSYIKELEENNIIKPYIKGNETLRLKLPKYRI